MNGSGGSLVTFLTNIANLMTGTLGQTLAIIAVSILGFLMMFGALDRHRGGQVIFGIGLAFSAAWLVSQLWGGAGSGAGF